MAKRESILSVIAGAIGKVVGWIVGLIAGLIVLGILWLAFPLAGAVLTAFGMIGLLGLILNGGTTPSFLMTEADHRRIVREELERNRRNQ